MRRWSCFVGFSLALVGCGADDERARRVDLASAVDAAADGARSAVDAAPPEDAADARHGDVEVSDAGAPHLRFRRPGAPRLVALGDVHGDLASALDALRTAAVIDEAGHWAGGETVVVQVGDQLDRGDDEREILDLFEQLIAEARAAGGAFIPLLGNHEIMNVQHDFRYVTEAGWADFADIPGPARPGVPEGQRGRYAAFAPGGRYARILAGHLVVVQVGDTIFAHGGVLPEHVSYGLDRINDETSAWFLGERGEPAVLGSVSSPIWSRHYSDDDVSPQDCSLARQVLRSTGARRIVVAHTVQPEGINAACDGAVWRIDVGLADYYGGPTQVLEIVGESVTVLPAR